MKFALSALVVLLLVLTGCSNRVQQEYLKIKKAESENKSIPNAILLFDESHPDFFNSKLDLGVYYLVSGNYLESKYFLEKAEVLLPSDVSLEDKALLYGSISAIRLIEAEFDEAWSYAKKAYDVPKAGKYYGYICGRILVAQNKEDEALRYFNECYDAKLAAIDAESARAYMYLLAKTENFQKAKDILEIYIENGNYFAGLGIFASNIYEKCGDIEKSIYMAFLDYEYQSCFMNLDDNKFLLNLDRLDADFRTKNIALNDASRKAIAQIKSLYGDSSFASPASDFYVSQYILCREKIRGKTFDIKDYETYISLEKYFKDFPSYYWTLSNLAPVFSKDTAAVVARQATIKIIQLNPNSIYVPRCREILGKSEGLKLEDCKKLLLVDEIENSLFLFIKTDDSSYLENVYEFLSLNDCSYIYDGVTFLKKCMSNEKLHSEFVEKKESSTGRLKDRLSYILA